jgi:hypothetical protein
MKRINRSILFAVILTLFISSSGVAGRYYDARTARWLAPDPALEETPPQELERKYGPHLFSMSPYNYGFDNPCLNADPDGRIPLPFFLAAAYLATEFSGDHPGGSPGLVQTTLSLGAIFSFKPAFWWAMRNPLAATATTTAIADAFAPPGVSVSPAGFPAKIIAAEARGAFQIAKEGGKHSGLLRTMMGAELKSLEKAVRSYEKVILEHTDKIANPGKYVEKWGSLSAVEQAGLIQKWQKDLARNTELKEVMRGLYEERKNQ